jgi:hypothetical protein
VRNDKNNKQNVTAATNAHAKIEKLLHASLFIESVYNQESESVVFYKTSCYTCIDPITLLYYLNVVGFFTALL